MPIRHHEKRAAVRLLCDKLFSEVCLIIGDESFNFDAIDYNYLGIALFGLDRIPDAQQCLLTFSYGRPGSEVCITCLPADIIHNREMDSGNSLGLQFCCKRIDDEVSEQLFCIHEILSDKQLTNRYGF